MGTAFTCPCDGMDPVLCGNSDYMEVDILRQCKACGKIKVLETNFYKHHNGGRIHECKTCTKIRVAKTNSARWRKHGRIRGSVTLEHIEKMKLIIRREKDLAMSMMAVGFCVSLLLTFIGMVWIMFFP